MRSSTTLLALSAATSNLVAAGHLSVPVSRQGFNNNHYRLLKRQDDTEPLTLEALNNITGGGYYSEFEVGTPPQTISFLLDTGSSDTWVNSVEADLCNDADLQATNGYCQTQFDPEDSSTFETTDEGGFDITYLDGRNIEGDYFEDTVTIGEVKIENQILGLALESVRPTGIMGLGFSINVAADQQYPTIINNMVDQGHIETAAFSLYLNDIDDDAGNILFGGIDRNKFIDDLAVLDLVSESMSRTNQITSFNVRIEGFDVEAPDGDRAVDMPNLDAQAILDSGSTISLLPDDQVQELWDEFGVLSVPGVLAPFVDCAYGGDKGDGYVFEFRFEGKTIRVPMDEMVIDAFADIQDSIMNDPLTSYYFSGWEGVCMFGIGSTANFNINTDQFTLLGATFLRSAYVVYDIDNQQLGLAQANLDSDDEDIVEIDGPLTDIRGVDGQSPSSTTTSASPSTTVTSTLSSTATFDSSSTATPEPSSTATDGDGDGDGGPTSTPDDGTDDSENPGNAGGRLIPSTAILASSLAGVLSALMITL